MKHAFLYFMIFMFFVFFIVSFSRFGIEYLGVLCTNQRYDSAVTYAAWSGFHYYDLERYATRKALANREYRHIYIKNDTKTKKAITEMIIENLSLNSDLTPKDSSFLEEPLEIKSINIYNPDVLPVTIDGYEYNVTTIEIVAELELILPFGKKKKYEKRTIVNADTFLIKEQKELK